MVKFTIVFILACASLAQAQTIVRCRTSGGSAVDCTVPLQQIYVPSSIPATKVGGGAVDNTEYSYLDGVTSSIQTQLNAKQGTLTLPLSKANGGWGSDVSTGLTTNYVAIVAGGAITIGPLLAAALPSGIDVAKLGGGTVSNATFAYLANVTSDIQTQLNGKQATLTLPLSKANGGFGQSVATGLTFGDGTYVDSSGVLQVGKVPFEFNLSFYGGTTTNEYAIFPGNATTVQLASVGTPLFQATAAGTCFLLVAQSDTPSSGTVTYRLRKSTNRGGAWADLSPSVTCNYTNGTTTCTDATNLGVIAADDWIQPTVQWSVSNGLGYYGGVRLKCRYN